MTKLLTRVVFVLACVSAFAAAGCADEDEVCIGGSCVTDGECLDECVFVCDGDFNVDGVECTIDGVCLCECFFGCV